MSLVNQRICVNSGKVIQVDGVDCNDLCSEGCRLKADVVAPADPINHVHYNGDDVMRIIERYKLDFLDGQVIKYILRAGRKDGASDIDDHKKAKWYLDRKVGNMESK